MEDDMPDLDDFEQELKLVKNEPRKATAEDYMKLNTRHIEDEKQQAAQIKQTELQAEKIAKAVQQTKKKEEFAGFKKGFFGGPSKTEKKVEKIPELKASKQDPLRIAEVQEAMKVGNYLEQTKKEWMTDNFLTNVEKNQKVQKLFTNPEYVQAIELFKTNPKEAMAKYGSNAEFMEGFKQFCMLMGTQFQNLAKKPK